MRKERLREIVDQCPNEVDIDEFVERLYLMRKIELAERAIERGDVVPHKEVEREFRLLNELRESERQIAAGQVVEHDDVKRRLRRWLD